MFEVAQLVVAELGGAGRSSYPRPLKEGLLSSQRTWGGGKGPAGVSALGESLPAVMGREPQAGATA